MNQLRGQYCDTGQTYEYTQKEFCAHPLNTEYNCPYYIKVMESHDWDYSLKFGSRAARFPDITPTAMHEMLPQLGRCGKL